jgi:hypothetical protein
MNSKDLLKYALIAVGAYLIYEYLQAHGGLAGVFGSTASAGTLPVIPNTGTSMPIASTIGTTPAQPAATSTPSTPPPPAAPVLDMTGLTVVPDINDSLTGTVKLNGVPTRLSIITASGAIYDSTGTEITSALQSQGIDIVALRTAFQNAPAGVSGLGAVRYIPAWLM